METNKDYTKGKIDFQGPKEGFNEQTYYTLHVPGTFDAIGFLYPKTPSSDELMKANVDRIIYAWNNIESLENENKELKKAIENILHSYNSNLLSESLKMAQKLLEK